MDRRLVLIVDDDAEAREILRQAFLARGYECEEAGDGAEALEQFRASRPLLTISDVRMPGMDGLEFLKAARALDPTAAIVMLTGADDVQVGVECMKQGASDYLVKPVSRRDILDASERALERRRLLLARDEEQAQLARRVTEVTRDLDYVSQYDALTGLANRALFQDRLGRAQVRAERSGQPLAVMLVDVDHFKAINESLGYEAGDLFLKGVAERLRQCVRAVDSIARLGADEFAIVLEGLGRAELAAVVAERTLASFAVPFLVAGRELFVTVSVGIAVYPADGADAGALIKNADAALSGAKEQGRNAFRFYTPDLNASALERLALQAGLRRALERGELKLYYQPQVELKTGRVTGVEALLRWHHPERGLVPPGAFIPLAEESGLIIPIGEWVLRAGCAQAQAWQAGGVGPLRVAVNLSARQFRHARLRESVAAAVAEAGLDPRFLELELTEGLLMDPTDAVTRTLADLKAMRLLIAIDDFGTGYSSLSYLKRFAVDILKIDQSFVRDLTTDPNALAIAEAIVALARSLRLAVVAEGVETREQVDALLDLGCDEGQGYFFSRPVPPDAFAQWLATWRS